MPFPLKHEEQKYLFVVQTLYDQQKQMYDTKTHSVDSRIVSIHQPHVRPIVRGKAQAKVEFGAKIHVSIIDGISFLDELSWDAFNEGSHMIDYVEKFRKRFAVIHAKYWPIKYIVHEATALHSKIRNKTFG